MRHPRRVAASLCLVALLAGCSSEGVPDSTLVSRSTARPHPAAYIAPPPTAAVTPTARRRAVVPAAPPLRVMSFNLRRKFHLDGVNFWEHRKDIAAQTILDDHADIVGTQECLADQRDDLLQRLPGYRFVGAGRDDGKDAGEMCGIFFRGSRFALLDRGHFWLSTHPDRPGSKSWGTAYPRMATWVKLGDRSSGRELFVFNTHLDHSSSSARREGAKLIREQIAKIAGRSPVVLTGDFNDSGGSDSHRILADASTSKRSRGKTPTGMVDTFVAQHGTADRRTGTRHGFDGSTGGDRIDWILVSKTLTPVDAAIVRTDYDGRYPSDHFPVTATLAWTPPSTATAAATPTPRQSLRRTPLAAVETSRASGRVQWQ